jgi:hypothetical protein
MKSHTAILCAILVAFSAQAADTFTINGKDIIVPAPKGFVRVTDEMTELKSYIQQMQDTLNDTLACYISESDVPKAMAGDIPALDRWFILKINKQLRDVTVGKNDFSRLKEMTKNQNQEMFEKVKAQLPKHMKDISHGVSQEFNIDFAMSVSQVVPLAPHYDSDNALGFSMFLKTEVTMGSEKENTIIAATSTFLNASGVVLFLYSYGLQNQLEWTRSASMKWAESVMASNIQPPQKSPSSRGFNWGKVFEKGVVGAIVGGLFALIAGAIAIFKKKD